MDRSAWKKRERQVAAVFGTRRRPGSGGWRRGDEGSDDALHPWLYIEVKSGRTDPGSTLFERTEPRAKKAGKEAVTVYLPYRAPVGLCRAEMRLSTLWRLLTTTASTQGLLPILPLDPVVAVRLGELVRHLPKKEPQTEKPGPG